MSENADDAKALQNIKDVLSDQAGEVEIPTFWQLRLTPESNGENTVKVNFPDYTYLTLTNICLPEITNPSDNQPVNEPVRVFAHVKGISEEEDSTVLIATLIPGKSEHQILNILFSPIDEATLEIKGKLPVDIVGVINVCDFPYEEEEEEEEEEDAKDEEAKDKKEKQE